MMKKSNLKLSTMIIMVVTGISILSIFIEYTGISGTFGYFLYYAIFLLAFFGISLWLKRDWICYLPAILVIIGSCVGIILLLISNTSSGSFSQSIFIILIIVGIMLSGISYIAAKLFIVYIINNEEIHLIQEFKDQMGLIAVSIGLISLVKLSLTALRLSDNFIYFIVLMVIFNILIILGVCILALILYAYDMMDERTTWISLLLFLLFIPISYLIKDEKTKFFIWMGLSNWLIFGTLLMKRLNKRKKERPLDIHDEGDLYD